MIAYQLQRSARSQHVKIAIQPSGEVVVVAPHDCPLRFIDAFVQRHQEWVEQHLAQVLTEHARHNRDSNHLVVFGKTYRKRIDFSDQQRIGVTIVADEIVINPVSNTKTSIEHAITQFLKTAAEQYIVPRTHQLAQLMDTSFRAISLRQQKTRWGSCSSQGNLQFNWRLVHTPTEVIDYVIIHELAHRRHMNHSSQFWEWVAQFDPEYRKHRGWLKREGMALG